MLKVDQRIEILTSRSLLKVTGKITRVVGALVEGTGVSASVGDLCRLVSRDGRRSHLAEVVGFQGDKILLTPLEDLRGFGPGSALMANPEPPSIPIGNALLGRVIDAFGRPLDSLGPLQTTERHTLHSATLSPLQRARIREPISTGIRAIDGLLTCGKGQRMGLFAGSGVGKSVLMGMIARHTAAKVNVIALIGERGREIREFIEKDLKEEGLARSVVIAVPSDHPPMTKIYGALAATAIAESFREQGDDVFLMMDSLTRLAMAGREIGLASGEPPTTKGYTPSVFAFMPKLLERAGGLEGRGSITGFYTVLVEADEMDDPIADTARSILDGHLVLSRRLASKGHFPAIDILESVSRMMVDITTDEHQRLASQVRQNLATYREAEELIQVGVYSKGSQPHVDRAIERLEPINAFLNQGIQESSTFQETLNRLQQLMR